MQKGSLRRLLIVFGTRPEAIKMAPIIVAARNDPRFHVTVCVTAQHREMMDQVLRVFEIEPDEDLHVMQHAQSVTEVIGTILQKLPAIISKHKPDVVLVQGDTATAFAGALAAFAAKIPVGHVEAGLRTYNLDAPFPEEALRQMITRVTTFHFSPTERNRDALLREGVAPETIQITGNTVIDALLHVKDRTAEAGAQALFAIWPQGLEILKNGKRVIVITGHRRESFGPPLQAMCGAISDLAGSYPDVEFVYPVHRNPNVDAPVKEALGKIPNVHLIAPLDYVPFVYLLNRSYFIISDSGGVQEEAPSLKKPVLVTRSVTEREEAVHCGAVKLVGTDRNKIVDAATALLDDPAELSSMVVEENPYGDGKAAIRILESLV